MWILTGWLLLGLAQGATPDPERASAVEAATWATPQELARPTLERAQLHVAPRRRIALSRVRVGLPMASDTDEVEAPAPALPEAPKHRSRSLMLGALGAAAVSGGCLLGASLVGDAYLDPSNTEPGRGAYRTNRVLGHAGYATGVASGALVLGALSMWEW